MLKKQEYSIEGVNIVESSEVVKWAKMVSQSLVGLKFQLSSILDALNYNWIAHPNIAIQQ